MAADTQILLETRRFRVERLAQTLPNGHLDEREIIRHPGAAVILPLVDPGHVCLIRNFRVAVNRWLLELPAGTLEGEEDVPQAARRELREETGYQARNMQLAATFYPSPGILDERMYLFVATDVIAGSPDREAGEQIENVVVPWDTALAMVTSGEIVDAKTIVGLLLYDRLRTTRGS